MCSTVSTSTASTRTMVTPARTSAPPTATCRRATWCLGPGSTSDGCRPPRVRTLRRAADGRVCRDEEHPDDGAPRRDHMAGSRTSGRRMRKPGMLGVAPLQRFWCAQPRCTGNLVLLACLCVSVLSAWCQSAQDPAAPIVAALRAREFSQALSLSQSALAAHPRDYRIWTLRGMATAATGSLPPALAAYQHALQLQPAYLPALEGAAQTEMQLGQDAAPLLEKILSQRPDDPPTHALLGLLDYRKHDCSAAVDQFRQAEAVIVHQPEALSDEGACLSALNRNGDAVAAFRDALALDPSNGVARYNLALAQFNAQQATDALTTLGPLMDAPPEHPDALALAAEIHEAQGDTAQAVTLLRAALLAAPRDLDTYLQFATLCFDHASPQVGVDILNAGIGELPREPRLFLVRGILLAQMGQFSRAGDDFDAASRLDPRLQFLGDAQGLVQSQEHNQEQALAHFRAAVRANPKDAYGYYLLAEALAAEGKPEGSPAYTEEISAATTAVRLDPGLVAARDLLSA